MGKKQAPKRKATGAKPGCARFAAPGKNSADGQQVINGGMAIRTPESGAATGRASEFGADLNAPVLMERRSEERRVGKECRSRGSPYRVKQKKSQCMWQNNSAAKTRGRNT